MIYKERRLAILEVLRGNTFQSKIELYSNLQRQSKFDHSDDVILRMDLAALEGEGFISINKSGVGKRYRILSIRMTELGLFELVNKNMLSSEKKLFIDRMRRTFPKKDLVKVVEAMPCRRITNVCYMSGSCYLAHKCSAAGAK